MPLGSRENDIGADRNPKGVVADKGDLDEYPHNREPRKNERERKSKIHNTSPFRCNKTNKRFSQRALLHSRSGTSRIVENVTGAIMPRKFRARYIAPAICVLRLQTLVETATS
jgi:hypothetical protein